MCVTASAERRVWWWSGPRGSCLGDRGVRCGRVVRGCPLIGIMASCGFRHAPGVGLPFLPFPVLLFLVFFELASSSGYSSRRALLPDRLDPSGRPPSESSQSSRSWGSSVFSACCAMVVVPLGFPPVALSFWTPFPFFLFSCAAAAASAASASALAAAAAAAASRVDFSRFGSCRCLLCSGGRFCNLRHSFCLFGGFSGCCLLCR